MKPPVMNSIMNSYAVTNFSRTKLSDTNYGISLLKHSIMNGVTKSIRSFHQVVKLYFTSKRIHSLKNASALNV